MKLVRLALAGASAFAIYKYTTGKGAKGEPVFTPLADDGPSDAGGAPAAKRSDVPLIEDQLSD